MVLGLVWDTVWSTQHDQSNRSGVVSTGPLCVARRLLEQRRLQLAVRLSLQDLPEQLRQRHWVPLCEGAVVFSPPCLPHFIGRLAFNVECSMFPISALASPASKSALIWFHLRLNTLRSLLPPVTNKIRSDGLQFQAICLGKL